MFNVNTTWMYQTVETKGHPVINMTDALAVSTQDYTKQICS